MAGPGWLQGERSKLQRDGRRLPFFASYPEPFYFPHMQAWLWGWGGFACRNPKLAKQGRTALNRRWKLECGVKGEWSSSCPQGIGSMGEMATCQNRQQQKFSIHCISYGHSARDHLASPAVQRGHVTSSDQWNKSLSCVSLWSQNSYVLPSTREKQATLRPQAMAEP